MKKLYVLYDERARLDVDGAHVLCIADSLEEARSDRTEMFPCAVIYEYDDHGGAVLGDGRLVE